MRLGAVISTAGGLHHVFERAAEMGCDSLMLFTKNNRQWHADPITEEDLAMWQEARQAHPDLWPVAGHASYLINIASPKDDLWERSYQSLKQEMERAMLLEISTLTLHPGSHTGSGEKAGLARIAEAVNRLLDELPAGPTTLCLETMAGQGTYLGYRFEQLAWLLEATDTEGRDRLGICFDPCHVFAPGYDLRTPDTYAATMDEFDRIIGLDRLLCFHLNDSKNELGSRKDRHAHIGEGEIGADGFGLLLRDERFADHPAHLETPKHEQDDEGNEIDMDMVNLETLRDLAQSSH